MLGEEMEGAVGNLVRKLNGDHVTNELLFDLILASNHDLGKRIDKNGERITNLEGRPLLRWRKCGTAAWALLVAGCAASVAVVATKIIEHLT